MDSIVKYWCEINKCRPQIGTALNYYIVAEHKQGLKLIVAVLAQKILLRGLITQKFTVGNTQPKLEAAGSVNQLSIDYRATCVHV